MVGPAQNLGSAPPGTQSASPSPTFTGVPEPPRRLLLLRHGQSTWNADGRWQGQADPPLSALGEDQARDAAGRLAPGQFSRIVASNLRRAHRTAEILAEALQLPVEVDEDLREIDVGEWQGLTRAEIRACAPEALADWSEGRSASTPGGELRTHLTDRARRALLRAAAAASPGDRVLLVSHGALIRNLDRALWLEPEGIGNLAGRWYEVDSAGALAPAELVSLADPEDRTASPTP
jgi:broad specificity phosphatase PhoE